MYIHVSLKGVYNMKKNNQLSVEKGTASKIYGLAYDEPRSGYSIAKEIGSQPHHVNAKIHELYKEGSLLKIEKKEWTHPKWQSNANILVKKIEQTKQKENITFTKFDKQVLYERFNNSLFRQLAYGGFCVEFKENPNANAVDSILCDFDTGLIVAENISYFREKCEKINTEKEYNNYIQQQRKTFESYKHKEPKLYSKARLNFNTDEDLIDSMIHSILSPLPKSLFEKCRGISSIGRKFQDIKLLIDEVTKFKINELNYGYTKFSDIFND